jgi:hypothetical protein
MSPMKDEVINRAPQSQDTGSRGAQSPSARPARRSDPEWLTALEAADYAGGISVDTVRVGCNLNRLKHVRIGGSSRGPIRTRREWVDAWLEGWVRGGRAA